MFGIISLIIIGLGIFYLVHLSKKHGANGGANQVQTWCKSGAKSSVTGQPVGNSEQFTSYNQQTELPHPPASMAISDKPSENNELWQYYSNCFAAYCRYGQMGKARCVRYDQARIREKEGAIQDAISLYFFVFSTDLWGYSELSEMKNGMKPSPIMAPAVVNRIRICRNKIKWSDDDLKNFLIEKYDKQTEYPNAKYDYTKRIEILIEAMNDFDKAYAKYCK